MIKFHPTYSRAETIHGQILAHLETLQLPYQLQDNVFDAPYSWFDLLTVSTAFYLANRQLTDKQVTNHITGFTQEQVKTIRYDPTYSGGRKYFSLLCKGSTPGEFEQYGGTVVLRSGKFLIDLFDLTAKPVRFDDFICEDTLDFHAERLQAQLARRRPDVLPDLDTIKQELVRVSGIEMGFATRQVPAMLTLFEGVLPIALYYMPNGVMNNLPNLDSYRRDADMLREVTKRLTIYPQSGAMPTAVALSHLFISEGASRQSPVNANFQVMLQYANLTNLLQPQIEVRRVHGNSTLSMQDTEAFMRRQPDIVLNFAEDIANKLVHAIAADQKMVATTLKRRREKQNNAEGHIHIDRVSQEMLAIIDRLDPGKGQDIRLGKLKNFKLKVSDGGDFFSGHSTQTKDGKTNMKMVSFRIRDGEFHVRVELSDGHVWENDRLMIHPEIPETLVASLKDKAASEVIDHPIAALLGPVKSAQNKAGHTEVRFHKIVERL